MRYSVATPLLAAGVLFLLLACSEAQAATFNVTAPAYGAVGDGKTDDRAAIQKAINAAIAAGPGSVVSVPAGTYLLAKPLTIGRAAHLTFKGASRVTTELITTPADGGQVIDIEGCNNVTVADFCIDGQVLNFTQGRITAFDRSLNLITVALDVGYPALDAPQMAGAHTLFTFYDPARLSYDGDHPSISNQRLDKPGVWKLGLNHLPVGVYTGEKVAVWNWGNIGGKAVGVDDSSNISLTDINDYCGGWAMPTICGGNTGSLNLTRFNVGPPAGSGRLITARGGMAAYNRAKITLKECDWRGIDDDCLDIGVAASHIISQSAPNRITVENAHWGTVYQPGDTLQVWDWANGNTSIRDTARITAVGSAAGYTTLTLDSPVTVLKPDPTDAGGGWDGFDRVYDLDQAGPVVVTGCKLQSNRARAALLKSGASITVTDSTIYGGRGLPALNCGMEGETGEGPGPSDITIMGCTFFGNDGPCLFVGNDNSYFLTAAKNVLGSHITVRGNTFRDNCLSGPDIGVNPQQYDYPAPVLVTCVRDVTISGNRFINNWGPNIGLFSDADVRVTGNTFVRPNGIRGWPEASFATLETVIYADMTRGLTLSGNKVSPAGPFTKSLLYTTASVTGLHGVSDGILQK